MIVIATSPLTNPWTILASWSVDPSVVAGLGLGSWWYLRAIRRLAGRQRTRWPRWRSVSFLAGLAVIGLALLSPFDRYSDLLLSVHMVQHLLLTMIAPPLLLLGAPVTLALRTARPPNRKRLATLLRGRAVRVLGNPLLGWILFAGALWATHLPAFYDATLRHLGLHIAEHLVYVTTALMFWRPMVGNDPGPRLSHAARILAMFLFMPQMTFLGLAIYGSDRPLYAPYIGPAAAFGTSAVADQHLAGAIMWSSGMFFLIPAMVAVLADWMRKDDREAARADAQLARVSPDGA